MIYHDVELKIILDSYCGLILDEIKRICWGCYENIEWAGSFLQLTFRGGRCIVLKTDPSEMIMSISDEEWEETISDSDIEFIDQYGKMYIFNVTKDAPFAQVIGERLVSNEYYETFDGFVIGVKMKYENKYI